MELRRNKEIKEKKITDRGLHQLGGCDVIYEMEKLREEQVGSGKYGQDVDFSMPTTSV